MRNAEMDETIKKSDESEHGDLTGRTAIVTGAGTGIGRAIALELARAGAHVVLVGRRLEPLQETAEEIAAESGKALAFPADIRDPKIAREVSELFPDVEILVHNAAAFAAFGALEDVPPEDFSTVFETGVLGPMRWTAALIPGMKQRQFGRIIFIGSVAGRLGAEGQVAYASAKSALFGLTRSLALEGAAFDVTCNLVELGLINTERVSEALPPGQVERLIHATPAQRAGEPGDVARVVRQLASPSSGFTNGAVIELTGGLGLGLTPPVPRKQA